MLSLYCVSTCSLCTGSALRSLRVRQVGADVSCIHNLLASLFSTMLIKVFTDYYFCSLFYKKKNQIGAVRNLEMIHRGIANDEWGKRWGRQMNRDSHRSSWCNHGYLYFMDGVILAGVGSEGQISSCLDCTHNLFLNIWYVDSMSFTTTGHVNHVKIYPIIL